MFIMNPFDESRCNDSQPATPSVRLFHSNPFEPIRDLIIVSIFLPNPKLLFHIHLSHTTRIRNNPHQPLSNILDLIVLVQETDVAFHRGSRVISKQINICSIKSLNIHVLQL